jgi:hypothetical protein
MHSINRYALCAMPARRSLGVGGRYAVPLKMANFFRDDTKSQFLKP